MTQEDWSCHTATSSEMGKAHLSRELPEPCQAQAGQCHSGPRAWIQCRKSGLESQLQHKHRNSTSATELTSLYLNFFVCKWGEHILVAVNGEGAAIWQHHFLDVETDQFTQNQAPKQG